MSQTIVSPTKNMEAPSNQKYDAMVIGGGHNGLTAAAYLGKAGLRVLILEKRPVLGGAAATEEVFPGFRVNTGAFDAGNFLPEILTGLNLEKYGLRFLESPVLATSAFPGGGSLALYRDEARTVDEIGRLSIADAAQYPKFLCQVRRISQVLHEIMVRTPPDIPAYDLRQIREWLPVALRVKRMGDQSMMDFIRALPMSINDFLDEWFETPALKAALGFPGVSGASLGPRGSGTAFLMLYAAANAPEAGFRSSRFVEGGIGALSNALAAAARERGVEICTGVGVSKILMEGDRATGLVLEDGSTITARMILSSADPRTTFFDLIGASNLELRFAREVKNIRFRGSMARVNLALDGLPDFTGLTSSSQSGGRAGDLRDRLSSRLMLCPDLETLERAYDESKYGSFSSNPCLDFVIPTMLDPALAPPGAHLMAVNVHYTPYHLSGQSWDDARERMAQVVIERLGQIAPDLPARVINVQALTPLDLEREYHLPEGDIYHGQMGLDQILFMRPVGGFGRYRTPVEGLYLCGSGAHPGGGVTGAPGYNSAREALKDWH